MVNRVYQVFGQLFCVLSVIFFVILSSMGLSQLGPNVSQAIPLAKLPAGLEMPAKLARVATFGQSTVFQEALKPRPASVVALAEDTLSKEPALELEEPLTAIPAAGDAELTATYLAAPQETLAPQSYRPSKIAQITPATSASAPVNAIQIAGRTVEIVDTGYNIVESGGHANKFGSKFLYGHNSTAVFGGIINMGTGNTFSVTENGTKTAYVVARAAIFEKVGEQTLRIDEHNVQMNVVAGASLEGVSYDLAIMTCYGEMLPGGDATHRYVLFANRL